MVVIAKGGTEAEQTEDKVRAQVSSNGLGGGKHLGQPGRAISVGPYKHTSFMQFSDLFLSLKIFWICTKTL